MSFTRRQFLLTSGASVLCAGLDVARARIAEARGLLIERTLDDIISRALAAARKAGASYADIRIMRRRREDVATREDHITNVSYNEDYGFGVRVVAQGAWGFAASSRVDPKEAERVAQLAVDIARANARVVKRPVTLAPVPAHVDVWQTPLIKDPFKIPPSDKAELLLGLNAEALKVPGVRFASASVSSIGEWKILASTDGAYIEQSITRIGPNFVATAVDTTSGEFTNRAHELPAMQGGWEMVENSSLIADARRIGEDAVAKLKAASVTPGKRDLILAPSNLWLTIHESVGHPTELDRALGYEANMAGTSFATVDKLGKLRYAAPFVTIFADKTTPGGLATCGYDDDGVKTQRWDLVKDGLFVGYQTTREQAGWIGEKSSRGCSHAQDYKSFPFQRMPNVSLAPGKKPLGAQDLIAATEDGIYITGNGSWSIDHQRYNFQFGGQMFYEVKHGKIVRPLKDVAYQSNTLEFWNSCDLVGGDKEWMMGGSLFDGKGEPGQANAVSHGCPPARFHAVNILNTNARGKRT
jgi:TldD protein